MSGRTVSDVYPSPWLRAEDLGGQARTVRIAAADVQGFRQRDGTTAEKVVVSFERASKRLVCNVTQARAIAEAAGTEAIDGWSGTAVVLTAARASNGKGTIAVHGVGDVEAGARGGGSRYAAPSSGYSTTGAGGYSTSGGGAEGGGSRYAAPGSGYSTSGAGGYSTSGDGGGGGG